MFNKEKINSLNAKRLGQVKPELNEKCLQLLALAEADGFDLLVRQGLRSIEPQNRLYAQGRTKPGKIVTNAKGEQSNHNFGRAGGGFRFCRGRRDFLE